MPANHLLTATIAGITVLCVTLGAATSVPAQDATPKDATRPPVLPPQPNPQTTVPEKVDPPLGAKQSGEAPTGSLSRQLENSSGVIKPPAGVDPEIHVPAPVPDPGTTKVIPPPGSPGSPVPVEPK